MLVQVIALEPTRAAPGAAASVYRFGAAFLRGFSGSLATAVHLSRYLLSSEDMLVQSLLMNSIISSAAAARRNLASSSAIPICLPRRIDLYSRSWLPLQ